MYFHSIYLTGREAPSPIGGPARSENPKGGLGGRSPPEWVRVSGRLALGFGIGFGMRVRVWDKGLGWGGLGLGLGDMKGYKVGIGIGFKVWVI